MDEVPISFDLSFTRTIDQVGKEEILIKTTGNEKCAITDGKKCKPVVIFKLKTMPKENFPNGIIVCVNKKGWINEK